jgi:hypothetical protein
MARKAAWIVSILLLLNTGGIGVYNGITELPDARTALQKSVTIGVFIYGVLGLTGAVALVLRKRSAVWLTILWSVVIVYVASTAALAYAGEDASVLGAISGGLGAALVGALVVWCARVVTRPASLAERVQQSPSSSSR